MSKEQQKLDRREFIKLTSRKVAGLTAGAAGLSLLTAIPAHARGTIDDDDQYDFLMPRVKFSCKGGVEDYWQVRPGGDANLLNELSAVIRCKIKPIKGTRNWQPNNASKGQLNAVVTFDEAEKLKKYPFLFMTGESHYTLSRKQKRNLKEYLSQGGFMLMDDCIAAGFTDHFYKSSYVILEELFGTGSIKKIPLEHEVFHNVYDFSKIGIPHIQGQPHGAHGLFIGDRLAAFLSPSDLHCGWCDPGYGQFGRRPFGPGGRLGGKYGYKEAIQMGINIIMYAISH